MFKHYFQTNSSSNVQFLSGKPSLTRGDYKHIFQGATNDHLMWLKHVKTIVSHPQVISIFMGGMFIIKNGMPFLWPCFTTTRLVEKSGRRGIPAGWQGHGFERQAHPSEG
jgi:hypothetical protein